jgi:hypothetical protein
MPMLIIKLPIALLFIFIAYTPLCSAETDFIEQFQAQPVIDAAIANRIAEYASEDIKLSLAQQKTELLKLNNQLEQLSVAFSDSAVFWFIRGLQHKNLASYYIETSNSALANSHLHNRNRAYEKALQLNRSTNSPLSAAIFSTMKHGLPADLKIETIKNEIAMGGNGDNDSYYWYLHWSNINQLEKAGRKEEARAAYKKMQKELKSSGMDMSIYTSMTEKIETETLKHSPSKKIQSKIQVKKQNPNNSKPEQKAKKAKSYDTKVIVISSIAVFSVLSLIFVVIYEIRKKRK